ncbi:MAG: galactokinase [bacterium]
MPDANQCARLYQQKYHATPQAAGIAPGRVEILGNHTDYNGGLVFTVAIDKTITVCGERMAEPYVTLFTGALRDEIRFPTDPLTKDPAHPWADYVKGVLDQLRKEGVAWGGFRAVIGGGLPIGAGVSSSAALEAATALFVQALYPFDMDRLKLAQLCRAAENEFAGMPCGLLDQFSSFFGRKESMIFLDCRDLSYKILPLQPPAPIIVLCDSGTRHELVESEYRVRREQCQTACRVLANLIGKEINQLRDVTMLEFMDLEDAMDDILRRRVRHVLYENQRVLRGVTAIQLNNLQHLGELMVQSHQSSRTLFENSCLELDFLTEQAVQIPGCYGAKLTGGGFGGSTVNLVQPESTEEFIRAIQERFARKFGRPCHTLVCSIGDGARKVEL